jgi:hypothetical protein
MLQPTKRSRILPILLLLLLNGPETFLLGSKLVTVTNRYSTVI